MKNTIKLSRMINGIPIPRATPIPTFVPLLKPVSGVEVAAGDDADDMLEEEPDVDEGPVEVVELLVDVMELAALVLETTEFCGNMFR